MSNTKIRRTKSNNNNSNSNSVEKDVIYNLRTVEESLRNVIEETYSNGGKYGFITCDWGFATPGGLGERLGGKFAPYEEKLLEVKKYFWPIEAYQHFEEHPFDCSLPKQLPPQGKMGEKIEGNYALHEFLLVPPSPNRIELTKDDLIDYRTSARLFIVLGTLSHLCGNSAPNPKTEHPLPEWIEDPLRIIAKRLDIEPSLSGHFLTTENWIWKKDLLKDKKSRNVSFTRNVPSMIKLIKTVEVKDRRYRGRIYKQCFVAGHVINLLVDANYAKSREEAVQIGRKLNDMYDLFEHVTGDHLLQDDYLFFRFRQETSSILDNNSIRLVEDLSNQKKKWEEDIMTTIRQVSVKDRRYHFRWYKSCFVGSSAVDLLMQNGYAKSRQDAVRIGRLINQRYNLFSHVCNDHLFKDEHLFYRFNVNISNATTSNHISSNGSVGNSSVRSEESNNSNTISTSNKSSSSKNRFRSTSKTLKERFTGVRSSSITEEETNLQSVTNKQEAGVANSIVIVDDEDDEFDEKNEFCIDHIEMLYPAFGNNHERINQLIPACMGYSLRTLPHTILDVLETMSSLLEYKELYNGKDDEDGYNRLSDLLHQISFSLSRCKEQFQLMTTDPTKRTYNSKYVSVRQTQPLSIGVLVRRTKNGKPTPCKGTSGVQFPYFHLLDYLLGRYHYMADNDNVGFMAKVSQIDNYYPKPQRDYIRCLGQLSKSSTLRGFLDVIGHPVPTQLMGAYNHLIECYAGEGGVLTAHCRKLYSYMHNNLQALTSGTKQIDEEEEAAAAAKAKQNEEGKKQQQHGNHPSACAMATTTTTTTTVLSKRKSNHMFAMRMFNAMSSGTAERWNLRVTPLMTKVQKTVYSTSESGGFTTVALDLGDNRLRYEYGDVVKVLLPNATRTTAAWILSLSQQQQQQTTHKGETEVSNRTSSRGGRSGGATTDDGVGTDAVGATDVFKLEDMVDSGDKGWSWADLWEALGWSVTDGVPLKKIARYIEQALVRVEDEGNKTQWIYSPLDLLSGSEKLFGVPPAISRDQITSLVPVSPRIYSVSGVDSDRVFLLVSKPQDGGRHHGYEQMADPRVKTVHCSFSPATFFLVPPKDTNLVCVATGTGISPFVGLVDAIGSRRGTYTIAHQCKSSDLFLVNSRQWLDFTACNPGATVMGFISGDRSRRNCPMTYIIRNGKFDETQLLGMYNSSAYYFECSEFITRMKEVYKPSDINGGVGSGGLNLAYCCGGVQSAIEPLKKIISDNGWKYELTIESYAVTSTLSDNDIPCQISGAIVDLNAVSPVHEGGDQILHQAHRLALDSANRRGSPTPVSVPDQSNVFWSLHPNAYNLYRCLRAPIDADFEAFATFLGRQAVSRSTVASTAEKYAEVALASPDDSKVVRIASELQANAIKRQLLAGDLQGAQKSAEYLEALLNHVPSHDEQVQRWNESLNEVFFHKKNSITLLRANSIGSSIDDNYEDYTC